MGYLEAVHRGKDPTMFVVLFGDSAAMAGLLIGDTGDVEKATTHLDRAIKEKYAKVKRVFIEAESRATRRAVAEAEAPNPNSGA